MFKSQVAVENIVVAEMLIDENGSKCFKNKLSNTFSCPRTHVVPCSFGCGESTLTPYV